jgi:hypothetical protein
MDPPRDVAQLGQGLLGVAVGSVDQLQCARRVERNRGAVLEFLLRLPQVHGEGRQRCLRPVVQVPLDAAQPGGSVVDGPGTGLLQGLHPLGEPAGSQQAPDEPPVDGIDSTRQPWRREQHATTDREDEERAGKRGDVEHSER